MQLRLWTACVALILCVEPALALDPRQDFSQYVQRRWTSDEGLPQNAVLSIAQTPDGYLWAATQEGLVRFDGVSFQTFDRGNTPELKSNFISILRVDPAGALWLGTGGGGLTRYASGSFRTYTVKDGLPHDIVTALAVDASSTIWVGTEHGLAQLSGGRISTLRAAHAPLGELITALLPTEDGSLWVATESGVSHRGKEGRWTSYGTAGGALAGRVRGFLLDRSGHLWMGTDRGSLVRFAREHFTPYGHAEGLVAERLTALLEDQDGNLWVGTSQGLYRRTGERFQAMGLEAEPLIALLEDAEGSLWAGTDGGGLLQLRSARLRVYTTLHGLPKNNVLSLHEDPEGALWVGTYGGGLARMQGAARVERWSAKEGLPSEEVTALHGAADGSMWVGLMKRGLARIEGGRVRLEEALSPLATASILALRVDRAGRLWIGTLRRGLYVLEHGTLRHYGKEHGLADETVYALEESRDGSLWVGTRRGLSRLRQGSFVSEPMTQPLAGATVLSLHEDGLGALWVGTYSQGLHLLHEGRYFAFTARHGLFNEIVFHILEDDARTLWMSCNKGIFSVSKAQLHAVAEGRAATVVSTVYGKGDGLRNTEGNGGSQPGAWKARDGKLWFPTVGGAVAIDPPSARAQRNRIPPQVHIEEVQGDGGRLETRGLARVPPGRGRLEFRYVGVSFISPEKLTFRYRLEGFDTEWIDAGTRRAAQYTNLPPGEYRFHVMAANSDGLWSEHEASVALLLEPHFHQTRWFRALVALIVGALGLGLHRLRVQQLQAQSTVLAERNRLAREIHDGLTQSLTGVLMQIDAALGYLAEAPGWDPLESTCRHASLSIL